MTTWRGKVQIHVRKYFESKYDKEIYPSKKGIAFTAWRDLKNQIPVMHECIECSENMLREEAGRIKQEFNQRNVRQLPPPDLYNAGANIPFQFQEEEKMPHQQQNYVYDNPIGFHQKKGQQFIYLSQTPTELMQIYPSNFKESTGKDQRIKGKMR